MYTRSQALMRKSKHLIAKEFMAIAKSNLGKGIYLFVHIEVCEFCILALKELR
jgi:hypothetical protein